MAVNCVILLALILFSSSYAGATTIYVHNMCGSTVCAKYWVPKNGVGGGCLELGPGESSTVDASPSWEAATMWAITNTSCSGQACNTGPPSGVTRFEITIDSGGTDFYDISVVGGYNIPLRVVPTAIRGCPMGYCGSTTASSSFSECYYPGGPNATKACYYGTNYFFYICEYRY